MFMTYMKLQSAAPYGIITVGSSVTIVASSYTLPCTRWSTVTYPIDASTGCQREHYHWLILLMMMMIQSICMGPYQTHYHDNTLTSCLGVCFVIPQRCNKAAIKIGAPN